MSGSSPWEIYTVLADSETPNDDLSAVDACGAGACGTVEGPADQPGATVSQCC